ncbi:hypothetical protein ACFYUY_38395 [Kitasatospora sp. NPDC004745]|uniref:hypothetical protein n=1 Tax=Kitasatospora sp. NPDC004745 TaxID=3364019 RepID=UPI0036841B8A
MPAPEPGRRGRRSKYCSTACKSKAARDKARADAAQAGRDGLDGLDGTRADVVRHAEAAVEAARAFLGAVDADPTGAYDAFQRTLASLGVRAQEAAEDVRDEVRWPGVTGTALELRRAEETLTRPDVLARVDPQVLARRPARPADSDRSVNPAPAGPAAARAVSDRPEKAPAPAGSAGADVSDRSETGAPARTLAAVEAAVGPAARAEDFEALRRAACTDPVVRFGEPERLDDLDLTFGEGWSRTSWDDPRAEDVHQLLHRGRPVGWTAPLPDGPWGRAGHIAAGYQGGRAAEILTDRTSGARTHRTVGDALDLLQRAHAEQRARAKGTTATPPQLALKRPTGWSTPSARAPERRRRGAGESAHRAGAETRSRPPDAARRRRDGVSAARWPGGPAARRHRPGGGGRRGRPAGHPAAPAGRL